MKVYIKPEMEIKSLVQNVTLAAEDGTVEASVPNVWWPK